MYFQIVLEVQGVLVVKSHELEKESSCHQQGNEKQFHLTSAALCIRGFIFPIVLHQALSMGISPQWLGFVVYLELKQNFSDLMKAVC